MRGDLGGAERVQGVDERSAPKTAEDIQQRHSAKGQHAQRVALSSVLPSQHARRNTHARTHARARMQAHAHARTQTRRGCLGAHFISFCAQVSTAAAVTARPSHGGAAHAHRPRISRRMRGRAAGGRQSHASSIIGSTGANKGKRNA